MEKKISLHSYIYGFVLSIALTFIPYIMVSYHFFTGVLLVSLLVGIGLIQLIVQMVFFLHMKRDATSQIQLAVFVSFFLIILIVMFGSLWIMQNLNYHMDMRQINDVMKHGEGF